MDSLYHSKEIPLQDLESPSASPKSSPVLAQSTRLAPVSENPSDSASEVHKSGSVTDVSNSKAAQSNTQKSTRSKKRQTNEGSGAVGVTTGIEDLIKARPNFPPSAPAVFTNPATNIITSKQLHSSEYSAVTQAFKTQNIKITPPKLFIRISIENPEVSKQQQSKKSFSTASSSADKALVLDLSKYIDPDFLLYNPEGLQKYALQKSSKTLNIYKYIASSKLKTICNEIRTMYGVDCKICNDEFVDVIGSGGCFMFCVAVYDCGVVFRVKKKEIDSIKADVLKSVQNVVGGGIQNSNVI